MNTCDHATAPASWNDFNDAEAQQGGFDLIPRGISVPVRMIIKPGGHDDHTQGWTGGYATQSFETGAVYLACEFVVTDGPFAKRKMWSNVGLHSPKGPTWGQMGRSFIRAVLNSARNVQPQDNSPQAAAARRINSFADLDGIEFLARVDVEKDGKGEDRNVVKIAIEPDHKDYVSLTGMSPAGGGHRGGGGHSGAPVQPTPAYAQPAQQVRPVVPTSKPAWAQ
ncbi:MAG: hypothetical protein Q8M20_00075 [Rhodocyclaceae bacterium]|nr:hypothetical protein [Rhodocyclaceae bacterium]